MLYHLLYPLHSVFGGFNVFRYITFRSIGAIITGFVVVLVLGPAFIRFLKRLQIGQVVREDGPETHFSKEGIPTMGGAFILAAITFSTLIWADLTSRYVWLVLGLTLWFGLVGAVDDYRKIKKKNSKGLSAKGKLFFQILGA
ncbi:MAG: phospho-N-acetylmuramoyl-pentapeptide-transferase, partial [Desulfobulbaceae bacterium]|nr:phospho-N-acetylmuramoyl-pentapeptide-transferase [Desulfobulbaceae bacterium]